MVNKSVLIIAGSDSSAGAGVQADLKTFSAFKVYAATIFTALTAQNTKGVNKILNIPLGFIENQIKTVATDLNINLSSRPSELSCNDYYRITEYFENIKQNC